MWIESESDECCSNFQSGLQLNFRLQVNFRLHVNFRPQLYFRRLQKESALPQRMVRCAHLHAVEEHMVRCILVLRLSIRSVLIIHFNEKEIGKDPLS